MPSPTPSYIKKTLQFPQELAEFQEVVRGLNPKSYLEVGAKYGGSLWAIANVMARGSRIVCVDKPKDGTQIALQQCIRDLKARGYDAHLYMGDSTAKIIVDAVKALGPYDLVLIDANHTEPFVRADFANYAWIGKTVCFHDIGWDSRNQKPGFMPIDVPKVWKEIKTLYADEADFREIKHDNGHNGFGIMQWRR